MKQKINWTNHFIELLVVVVGITIAFMLESWSRETENQQVEQQYLNSFKNDIMSDASRLDSTIIAVENKLTIIKKFIDEVKNGKVPIEKAEGIIPHLLATYGFSPKQTTFQSVTNSGALNLVSDYKLKEEIVSYYNFYEELKIKEQVLYDYLLAFVLPYIYKNVDFLSGEIVNKSVPNSFEFKNIVTGYFTLAGQNQEVYKNYKSVNKRLLKIILKND